MSTYFHFTDEQIKAILDEMTFNRKMGFVLWRITRPLQRQSSGKSLLTMAWMSIMRRNK